jgi:hypothetical protein
MGLEDRRVGSTEARKFLIIPPFFFLFFGTAFLDFI